MISWELYSDAPHEPSSFRVRCYNQQGAIEFMINLLVNTETLTHVSVGGILSSVSYVCCVSVTYYYRGYYYEAEGKCASTDPNMPLPDSYITSAPNQTLNQPVTIPSSTQKIPASIGSEKVIGSDLSMRASIVSGVLGSNPTAVVGNVWRSTAILITIKKHESQNASTVINYYVTSNHEHF